MAGQVTQTAIAKVGQAGILALASAWIGRRQRELSSQIHAAGDERARALGWEVTESTGRFGFGTRIYRDPRFDDRCRRLTGGIERSRTRDEAATDVGRTDSIPR